MTSRPDVLVIGAGAAGLTAARELSAAGLKTVVPEARDRVGGRIFTDHSLGFPVELGAEFVHGRSRDMFELIKAKRLEIAEVAGEMRRKRNGVWGDSGSVMAEVNHLFENMPHDGPDQSFQQYIDASRYGPETKQLALDFVEGFHAANPERVSVHWLVKTTSAEEEIDGETSFRVKHGYSGLVDAILEQAEPPNCELLPNSAVTEIQWQEGRVTVKTRVGALQAPRAIITLPLGVLQSGAVHFSPPLPLEKQRAFASLEMGRVIRVSLCFRDQFWETLPEMRNLSFLFTDDPQFPTWWSPNPLPYPILTGWAAGRYARALAGKNPDQLIRCAMESLGRILEIDKVALGSHLQRGFVHDWQADPFSRGAYSYVLQGGLTAPLDLEVPLEETLFFAGEAASIEGHNGTVHGAMGSGKKAAAEILRAAGVRPTE